jgi:ATP sulfurylase
VIRFQELSYNRKTRSYQEAGESADSISLSGTEVRERYLKEGRPFRIGLTRPEVARILERLPAIKPAWCLHLVHRFKWRGQIENC